MREQPEMRHAACYVRMREKRQRVLMQSFFEPPAAECLHEACWRRSAAPCHQKICLITAAPPTFRSASARVCSAILPARSARRRYRVAPSTAQHRRAYRKIATRGASDDEPACVAPRPRYDVPAACAHDGQRYLSQHVYFGLFVIVMSATYARDAALILPPRTPFLPQHMSPVVKIFPLCSFARLRYALPPFEDAKRRRPLYAQQNTVTPVVRYRSMSPMSFTPERNACRERGTTNVPTRDARSIF